MSKPPGEGQSEQPEQGAPRTEVDWAGIWVDGQETPVTAGAEAGTADLMAAEQDKQMQAAEARAQVEALAADPATPPIQTRPFDRRRRALDTATSYVQFDADRELRVVRKERKPREYQEYKDNVLKNREGVAETARGLTATIEANPDVDFETLWSQVAVAAPEVRLSVDQLEAFHEGIEEYAARHHTVEYYTQEFTDTEIVQRVFGITPRGEFKIIKGPMTIGIVFDDSDDYNAALSMQRTHDLSDETRESLERSTGAAIPETYDEDLDNTVVILRRKQGDRELADSVLTRNRVHEDMHYLTNLIGVKSSSNLYTVADKASRRKDDSAAMIADRITMIEAREERRSLMDDDARGEVISYLEDGSNVSDIRRRLETSPGYNYAEIQREKINDLGEVIISHNRHLLQQLRGPEAVFDPVRVKEVIDGVMEQGYHSDLKRWLDAVETMLEEDKDRARVISVLQTLPIQSWPGHAHLMRQRGEARRAAETAAAKPRRTWRNAYGLLRRREG